MKNEKWYGLSKKELFNKLDTSFNGLSIKEANIRLKNNGYNELPKEKQESFLQILLKQLIDPIEIILVIAVIFSFVVNEYIDAYAILFIIMIDVFMGAIQERKAIKNVQALASMINVKCSVLRDNKEKQIDAKNLVIGDIVILGSGDKISADLRVLESTNLTVDESILTGESLNVIKNAKTIKTEASINERKNILYAGTTVMTGRALAVVICVGINTELGKIADQVSNTKDTKSPLTIRMNKFSKQISGLIVIIALIITVLLFVKGTPGSEIFLSVIALSVSAMPEGLSLALTLALTIASNRMAKKNVIVKKLNSVESLGSCTIIASDKTGTLTENEQTAKFIILPDNSKYEISGSGYNDEGQITSSTNSDLNLASYISKMGVINNEAAMEKVGNEWMCLGDSIDIAFLALGHKFNLNNNDIKVIGTIPYESDNKYSAVFYIRNNKTYCTIKGSIEKVMEFTNKMGYKGKVRKLNKKTLDAQNQNMCGSGFRVIAIASGEVKLKNDYKESDIKDLTFNGLVGFIDPVRKEVSSSIEECKTAGIKVIMITGDHPLTAYAIGRELQLIDCYDDLVTGNDIDDYLSKGEEEFDKFISNKKIFARVSPLNKLSIIESYKRQGEFVAVTGDGVNDTPALKAANIGIAMGSGTESAKETAKMIIIDDNFTSIVAGIKEGRNAYSNIRKICYLLLSCGIAEVLFFVLSIILDMPMPLVAIQLLWLNIVTDGLQDMALSFEKAEKNIMKKPPRDPKENLFNKELFREVAFSGIVIGGIVFVLWLILINIFKMEVYIARGYIMTLMVFIQNMHVLNCRSENESVITYRSKNNFIYFSIISAIVLQILIMEIPVFSKFLQTSSIPFMHLLVLFAVSLLIIVIMEIYKAIKKSNI